VSGGARLAGKRTIVTGAASGIGRATALRFAAAGARVLAADVDAAGVAETVRMIDERGGGGGGVAKAAVVDVGAEAAVAALVGDAVAAFGGLDVMFANAGITGPLRPLDELDAEAFAKVLQVNLIGAFLCVKYAARHMRANGGGSIVCTASVAALRSGAGPLPYAASKAGVVSLVQNAAMDLAGTGVRVNAICPGLIETGMTRPVFEGARAAGKEHKIGQLNPTRRGGQPDEIANAALFLASDESSYFDGAALVVDGGLHASLPFVPGKFF
jgi:NAD(P)-dependent dehydrogenase (short-subunit alcohol dehydrogenase family)